MANASTLFAAFVIAPFAVLFAVGLPELDTSVWTRPCSHPIHWGTFLSVLLWNTSGYDSVGALAAEVRQPARDFPIAMVSTIVLVTLVYILPLSVAISLDEANLAKWTDGHFTRVAEDHVGEWLSACMHALSLRMRAAYACAQLTHALSLRMHTVYARAQLTHAHSLRMHSAYACARRTHALGSRTPCITPWAASWPTLSPSWPHLPS